MVVNFLFRGIGQHWKITVDDEELEGEYALAAMCNGRCYGGGSTPIPEARMDDGVLQTVLVKNISRPRFATLFGTYSAGDHAKLPQDVFRIVTPQKLRICSEQELTVCLDGECFRCHDVTMGLSPKKLLFFGPQGCDPNATAR